MPLTFHRPGTPAYDAARAGFDLTAIRRTG